MMWKLILADSFHLNNNSYPSNLYIICLVLNMNTLLQMRDSRYMPILMLWVALLILSLAISPIQITKGLYLCPLTENDRKRYLKSAFLFRFIIHEIVFAAIMIIVGVIKRYDYQILILIYISVSVIYLVTLLIAGFYNPEMVKRQYFITKKLPIPTNKQPSSENKQKSQNGIYLLVIALILSCIGLIIIASIDSLDNRWLFFYIPAYILCILCILVYFLKYFDAFITINANYEVYSFTPKKKAGVINAD